MVVHCVNHNFELALLDLRKEDPYLKEFEETLKSIFSLHHWSGKLTREFSKFGALKDLRWSASSFRALNKLATTFPNLCRHLEALAASRHKHADRAKGLLQKVRTVKFVKYLHYMLDFLCPCSILSKPFQAKDV